ncbi:MAG: ABC transporter ATP-binding protein [Rhodospirillaceae bacterium]|nr:ABC transporter ATP-binding protein [Rhodospirillaceae bacterium]
MNSGPLLDVRLLGGGYGPMQVLHGVDLTVQPSSITALVGGNGAGKTTTMRMLAGLLLPKSGTVMYQGKDITTWDAAKRVATGIALVPEGRLVFPDLSVEQNLRLGAISPSARPHTANRLEQVYSQFPRLRERRRQIAGTLSGGEQQMLALGRGLMSRPKILLLDEPSLGLAPMMVDQIFETISGLTSNGMTILLSEQNIGRALKMASQAYVIENGRISLDGEGWELAAKPEVQRAYLGL